MPMWDEDDFDSLLQEPISVWDQEDQMAEPMDISHVVSMEDEKCTIVGRVHKKSRIIHFMKRDANKRYPFFFGLVLGIA